MTAPCPLCPPWPCQCQIWALQLGRYTTGPEPQLVPIFEGSIRDWGLPIQQVAVGVYGLIEQARDAGHGMYSFWGFQVDSGSVPL